MSGRLDKLYNKSITILRKEIKHIELLSIGNKLEAGPARDLTNYIKLLRELKTMEADIDRERAKRAKETASDAELEAAVVNAKKKNPKDK